MENLHKPIKVIKPNLFYALFPFLLKNFFISALTAAIAFLTIFVLIFFNVVEWSLNVVIWWLISVVLFFSFAPLLVEFLYLTSTTYSFYRGHVNGRFKFIIEKSHSAPYSQIVNITVKVNLWGRICKSGDVIISTAEDKKPALRLRYVKNPKEIEHYIYNLAHNSNNR